MKQGKVLEDILIQDIASEGNALFRHEGKVFFIKNVVPGDIVNATIIKNKTDWGIAELLRLNKKSDKRIDAFCKHFGICGGCKWQMLNYEDQLFYKKKEVIENFKRIGKIDIQFPVHMYGSDKQQAYRNKIEFAFSNKTFLTNEELKNKDISTFKPALGFHVPKIFDKIIHIDTCYLIDDFNNQLRNSLFNFCIEKAYTFYDIRMHHGQLRNLIIRHTALNQILVNIVFSQNDTECIDTIMNFVTTKFPQINSLYYTVNTKFNDTLYDLEPVLFHGSKHIVEVIGKYKFNISPKSFFQTNSFQTFNLYNKVAEFAELNKNDNVLDLYCGVGSIGIFLSASAKKILGIEIIPEAIEDAKMNAQLNNLNNTDFIQGDIEKLVKNDFFEKLNFTIDVLILDPPRAGIPEKLIPVIIKLKPRKIIYVSCNSATQSRDIALLGQYYNLTNLAVYDMFPHTYHTETVAQLKLK